MTSHRKPSKYRVRPAWVVASAVAAVALASAAALPGAFASPPHLAAVVKPAAAPPAVSNGTTNNSDAALPSPMTAAEQAQLNNLLTVPQCTLNVPASPLTAGGLTQPWFLENATATCAEDMATGAFLQATILDPATGRLSVYYPLVVPAGQTPAVPINPLTLPPGAIVTVWSGFNGNQLKLVGPGAGFFVNFAQQSWAGSPRFFQALRTSIADGLVKVPPTGTASDGLPCPTTRDFSIVDQDQSDNVPSAEIVTAGGAVAQDTPGNRALLPGAREVFNGSDQKVVSVVGSALGCKTWSVPDDTVPDGAVLAPSAPLQEEQAATFQAAPTAVVPGLDNFVTNNGQAPPAGRTDQFLQNLYRLQVGQPETGNPNDTPRYCALLGLVGEPRLQLDFDTESQFPAPVFVAMTGVNAALALANRFSQTWTNLNCQALTGVPSPIRVTLAGNTAIAAQYMPYNGRRFGLGNLGSDGTYAGGTSQYTG